MARATEIENGRDALTALGEGAFDLLVTDLHMPGLSGGEAIARAREVDPGLLIVLMSGSSGASGATGLVDVGASFVLAKPFGVPELVAAIESMQPSTRSS